VKGVGDASAAPRRIRVRSQESLVRVDDMAGRLERIERLLTGGDDEAT
jgi:hypothetical protein